MLDLTIVIITKNEEQNLKKCIESFKSISSRVVIVDSYSTDGTKRLCEKIGKSNNISFYEHKFANHSEQLNWAFNNTNIDTTWIMRMDADEELTPELVDELKEKLPNIPDNVNGIVLKRRVYFMGRWIKHGGKYPELLLRVFRNGFGECEQKLMDEHLIIKSGNTIKLDKDIIDNNNKSLEWWINKHNWYSNKEVEDYQDKLNSSLNNAREGLMNESISKGQAERKRYIKNNGYYKLPLFFRAHIYYIYRYYIRLGFLDGQEGRIYHFLQAYWYRFLVDAKIYECYKFNINMEEQEDLK